MLSVLGVLMFATVPWWPTKLQSEQTPPVSLSFGRAGTVCLIAIFLYYVAQAAVWAFLEALGTTVGQPTDRIASALALVGIPGVAASLLVSVVSKRLSLRQGLLIGFGLTLGSLYLLTVHAGMWTFGLGVGLFYFAWCGTVPFQFASAAASDLSGNAVAAFPAADGLGLAAGPAIAGAMVMQLGTHSVVALAVACTALGIGLFYWISPSSAQVHRIAKQV
jgi:predicted MFS family arabinose efflux permease